MTANADGSIIADTLQSAADQTVAAENAANENKSDSKGPNQQLAATDNKAADKQAKPETPPVVETATQTEHPVQVALAAPQTKSSSLFGMFGKKQIATTPQEAAASENVESQTPETPKAKTTVAEATENKPTAEVKQAEAEKPAEQEKPAQVTSLFGSAKNANAFASPQRPTTASQGSIARLFNEDAGNGESKSVNKKLAVVRPAPKSTREYNYSLPGVRPNGGFEIKHRKSIYDDSDIDANEYDDYASVQLASAPGLARLAPNGLKVQRETVDVACLKPQLVTMLKTMERHFRKPVMVTSGYRSPTYNRKVNGARKSLHMICAAADIQISGVSKHEIARFARNMPGRGGVGTYCHTASVHVDIGPERDWNWSCKR